MVDFLLPRIPIHTRRYADIGVSDVRQDACFLFAVDSVEPRGRLPVWQALASTHPERCVVIQRQGDEEIEVDYGGQQSTFFLRDDEAMKQMFPCSSVYMDLSGLAHHVWGALLRVTLANMDKMWIVYAEPKQYKSHPSPASATVFDLSKSLGGVAPLPGMARLSGPDEETESLLVTFLGFEGNRARRVALSLDPVPKIVPIVGVPGFRVEYPNFTISCNRDFLADYQAHSEIRLARASCPFEAYNVLSELHRDYPEHYLYIAPIGTKPHALGAVKYAIENPSFTEILYDHPTRKAGRTQGIGTIHVYEIDCDGFRS